MVAHEQTMIKGGDTRTGTQPHARQSVPAGPFGESTLVVWRPENE
jgi:hypothetical protein